MKNIPISNQLWKRLRKHRDELGFKHYTATINYITTCYEIHQSTLEERTDEIMSENKRALHDQLSKNQTIFRGYDFPYFYHIDDGRLIFDEVKSKPLKLSKDQKCLMEHLIKAGIRYRIWNVDKSGNAKIVYDSDNIKQTSALEEKINENKNSSDNIKQTSALEERTNEKKKHNNNDKMWDI